VYSTSLLASWLLLKEVLKGKVEPSPLSKRVLIVLVVFAISFGEVLASVSNGGVAPHAGSSAAFSHSSTSLPSCVGIRVISLFDWFVFIPKQLSPSPHVPAITIEGLALISLLTSSLLPKALPNNKTRLSLLLIDSTL